MHKIKLTLEYNGSGFHGWQFQPGLRTIQGELHRALETVSRQTLSFPVAAGRTDAGVHARAQVAHVELPRPHPLQELQSGVSQLLKYEVSIIKISEVEQSFHALRDATQKHYAYTIWNAPYPPVLLKGRVWHVVRPLCVEFLRTQFLEVIGEHDFSSFRGANCNANSPVRTIDKIEVSQANECIQIDFYGRGFLKHMVRNLAGTVVDLATGKLPDKSLGSILEKRSRIEAGRNAPPYGLCLESVMYEKEKS